MKKTLVIACCTFLMICFNVQNPLTVFASPNPTKTAKIDWWDFDKTSVHMKYNPKKVYIVIYTPGDYWCKTMGKTTFSNKKVIQYLSENFYCIKFNAKTKEDITYKGKVYHYDKKHKIHGLAIELMNGKISFPTSVLLEENFKKALPVPGYLKVRDMELILKYMGEGKNKTMPWSKYQKEFKPVWK